VKAKRVKYKKRGDVRINENQGAKANQKVAVERIIRETGEIRERIEPKNCS
jgi:hypothetical protein